MRILGIDPGYAIMGYGIIEKHGNRFVPIAYGAITTDKDVPMPERLRILYDGLIDVINEYKPDELSIEQLYFNTNAKTAIFVGQARGVAVLACVKSGLSLYEYTPLEIKIAMTGYGRAEKKQVQAMVKMVLKLDEIPKPDDVADALAAAICHAYSGEAKKSLYTMK